MQIIKDDTAYLGLQQELVRTLAGEVRDTLRDSAEGGATFEEAVTAITVRVAEIIDGSRPIAHDGKAVVPMLMFGLAGEDDAVTEVLSADAVPPMHEQALAAAERALAE